MYGQSAWAAFFMSLPGILSGLAMLIGSCGGPLAAWIAWQSSKTALKSTAINNAANDAILQGVATVQTIVNGKSDKLQHDKDAALADATDARLAASTASTAATLDATESRYAATLLAAQTATQAALDAAAIIADLKAENASLKGQPSMKAIS
jgi:hypothetical protein